EWERVVAGAHRGRVPAGGPDLKRGGRQPARRLQRSFRPARRARARVAHRHGHGVALRTGVRGLARALGCRHRRRHRPVPRRGHHRQHRLAALHELHHHRRHGKHRGAPDADGAGRRRAGRGDALRVDPAAGSGRARARARRRGAARQVRGRRGVLDHALAMRVLIIDDDEDLHTLLTHYVTSQWPNAAVDHYDPKVQAIPGPDFPLADYDVLVLDYMLGREDGDGLEWLAHFKGRSDCPKILFLTGAGNEVIAVKAMKAGADDYQRKQELTRERLITSLRDLTSDAAQKTLTPELAARLEGQSIGPPGKLPRVRVLH